MNAAEPGAVLPVEHEYLTVAQVAVLLQVKPATVYTWVRDDPSLPALKIAGTVRFRRVALLGWLREHEQGRPARRKLLSVAEA